MAMKEVLRTTDEVYLSFAQAVLRDAGISTVVLDSHMSVMQGSLPILPRRLMVTEGDFQRARRALAQAGNPLA